LKVYCFDTSGLSNPHEAMPEEIAVFQPIWACVRQCIVEGRIATTAELYAEMCHITGEVGECIKANKGQMLLEVGDSSWNYAAYIALYDQMRKTHHEFISEYSQKSSAKTICLSDLTIVALAKTLGVSVVSMESRAVGSPKHKRIPDICDAEKVLHHTFNDFLMIEGLHS
jgi:hypothetical protein